MAAGGVNRHKTQNKFFRSPFFQTLKNHMSKFVSRVIRDDTKQCAEYTSDRKLELGGLNYNVTENL